MNHISERTPWHHSFRFVIDHDERFESHRTLDEPLKCQLRRIFKIALQSSSSALSRSSLLNSSFIFFICSLINTGKWLVNLPIPKRQSYFATDQPSPTINHSSWIRARGRPGASHWISWSIAIVRAVLAKISPIFFKICLIIRYAPFRRLQVLLNNVSGVVKHVHMLG